MHGFPGGEVGINSERGRGVRSCYAWLFTKKEKENTLGFAESLIYIGCSSFHLSNLEETKNKETTGRKRKMLLESR